MQIINIVGRVTAHDRIFAKFRSNLASLNNRHNKISGIFDIKLYLTMYVQIYKIFKIVHGNQLIVHSHPIHTYPV